MNFISLRAHFRETVSPGRTPDLLSDFRVFRTVTGHWRAIPKAPQQTGRKMPRLSRGALLCTEGGSNMTFQQLSFVVEVANCESINKAAERLYTSQSNAATASRPWRKNWESRSSSNQKGRFRHGRGAGVLELCKRDHRQKIFVEDLYAKSHFRKQYFSVSSMRSFLSQHAHHKALAADFRRPRRLYLYQAEKTVFLRCSG